MIHGVSGLDADTGGSLGRVDLNLDSEIFAQDLFKMVARFFQHFQPAVLPIANTGEPGGTSAAREALSATALEVHLAVPVENVALPDVLNRLVVRVRKKLGSAKRDILTAKRNSSQGIDIQTLKRPHARLLPFRW